MVMTQMRSAIETSKKLVIASLEPKPALRQKLEILFMMVLVMSKTWQSAKSGSEKLVVEQDERRWLGSCRTHGLCTSSYILITIYEGLPAVSQDS
jgi:hypothetical protein